MTKAELIKEQLQDYFRSQTNKEYLKLLEELKSYIQGELDSLEALRDNESGEG